MEKLDKELIKDDYPEIYQIWVDSISTAGKVIALERAGKPAREIRAMELLSSGLTDLYASLSFFALKNHPDLDHNFYGDLYK